jgi:hypothetical protein
VRIAFLRNKLPTNLSSGQARVQTIGAKVGVGLALCIHQGFDVVQQPGQMIFCAFAATQREGVHTLDAPLQFTQRFAQGLPIPSERALGLTLTAVAQFLNGAGHKSSAFVSFERLRGLDQPCASAIGEFEHTASL